MVKINRRPDTKAKPADKLFTVAHRIPATLEANRANDPGDYSLVRQRPFVSDPVNDEERCDDLGPGDDRKKDVRGMTAGTPRSNK